MPRFVPSRRLGALVLLIGSADCAKTDATPAGRNLAASGGEVAARPAAVGRAATITDSLSARADRGRIRGADSAKVWLVEISDFQCPYCKMWHDKTFPAIDKQYVQTGKVRLAYLNYPIPSIHPHARAASEAAMCASAQNKFWELHSSLYTTQETWAKLADPAAFFDSLATAAGVDRPAWQSCMSSHAAIPLIDADRDRSTSSGVQSTPTFFVGDKKIEGAAPLTTFRLIIDSAVAKARGVR